MPRSAYGIFDRLVRRACTRRTLSCTLPGYIGIRIPIAPALYVTHSNVGSACSTSGIPRHRKPYLTHTCYICRSRKRGITPTCRHTPPSRQMSPHHILGNTPQQDTVSQTTLL